MAAVQGSAHCLSHRSDRVTNCIAQVSVAENKPELSFCCCNKRPWASPGYLVTCFSLSMLKCRCEKKLI